MKSMQQFEVFQCSTETRENTKRKNYQLNQVEIFLLMLLVNLQHVNLHCSEMYSGQNSLNIHNDNIFVCFLVVLLLS